MTANPWLLALLSGSLAAVMFGVYRLTIGRRMGQRFRDLGPEHHKLKGFVPTGTGIVFVILLALAGIYILVVTQANLPIERVGMYVCWAAAAMGLLGWIDDRNKVKHGSEGLKARYKLPIQILVGAVFLYFLFSYFHEVVGQAPATLQLPWPAYAPWWIFFPVGLFVWLGALNGANFTDGLDGLLSSTTIIVLAGAFVALLDGREPLAVPAAVGTGALVAFLIFNWKPALIYMGDTGSLAVGALVAGLFLAKGWWLFLGLCAIVWVIEVASVLLQVAWFRIFKRRIFLMSPIHHHFEMAGWGERRTVFVFTLLQILGCVVAFLWLRKGMEVGLIGMALLIATFVFLILRYSKRMR
ncbi:MAG: phospho-N-acetylmuramoyl-pentapeptide-transferase [bacterium]|nr:phospho-N-acetylmuramoyl-pentapeptide-transferase [bacterium]